MKKEQSLILISPSPKCGSTCFYRYSPTDCDECVVSLAYKIYLENKTKKNESQFILIRRMY